MKLSFTQGQPTTRAEQETVGQLRFRVIVFMTEGVGRVVMGGHKIDRHFGRLAEFEKFFYPSITRRRRPPPL